LTERMPSQMTPRRLLNTRKRGGIRKRWGFLLLAGTTVLLGCKEKHVDEVTLQVGPDQLIRFTPKSGFAHYFEIPGRQDILRIFLASYEVGCQDYKPPEPGEVFVVVTVQAPPSTTIEPGKFEWLGLSALDAENDDQEDVAPQATALPLVRLAEDSRPLPPGGALILKKLETEAFGLVEGELAFRDASLGEAAKTALIGSFSVRLCQLELDETRRNPSPGP
jgi:hypothetical protein